MNGVPVGNGSVPSGHFDPGPRSDRPDLVDGADGGMIEGRGGARLAQKPGHDVAPPDQALGQDLDGDRPAQHEIFGAVNHAHPARAGRRQATKAQRRRLLIGSVPDTRKNAQSNRAFHPLQQSVIADDLVGIGPPR